MKGTILKIAVAPDSFKGSMTALEAASCIERGLRNVLAGVSVKKIPMADGGDGTVQAMVSATGGRTAKRLVRDPLGRKIKASFGLTGDGSTAIIEMAAASGLTLLKPHERNPMITSSYGTGELIRHALDLNVRKILVGIGGSATNDGGMGMARALGVRFTDGLGRDVPEGGGSLISICRIDISGLDSRLRGVVVEAACDVDNPLVGARGAARVYSPQKGATPAMVNKLEQGLRSLSRIIRKEIGIDIADVPGAGAAGGLGAGLMAFLGARLRPGVDIVVESVNLERRLKGCDIVITGEGRMDGQTVFGKAPAGVARVAKKLGLPVIAIAGSLGKNVHDVLSVGIDAYFSALWEPLPEGELPARGPDMLTDCAEQVARLIALKSTGRERLRVKECATGFQPVFCSR